jgi:hypothetical protein
MDQRGALFYLGLVAVAVCVGLILHALPPRALPSVAVGGWLVVVVAGLAQVYARGRCDLLVRGWLFALAAAAVCAASVLLIDASKPAQLLWPLAILRALLLASMATVGLDVMYLAHARLWGREPQPVPNRHRWTMLALAAANLLVPLLYWTGAPPYGGAARAP